MAEEGLVFLFFINAKGGAASQTLLEMEILNLIIVVVTRCCQIVPSHDQEASLVLHKRQEKCFGVAGVAR